MLVFEDGRMVDDTAITLSPEQRKAYREAAFLEIDLRREQDAVKKLERAALREARRREEANRQILSQSNSKPESEEKSPAQNKNSQPVALPSSPEELDDSMVNQLKALISNWDRQNGAEQKP